MARGLKKHGMRAACLTALCLLMASAGAAESAYTPGVYTASEFGMGGDVVVAMTFDAGAITAVQISGDKETPGIGDKAMKALAETIMEEQSADVDSVASATITSEAVIKAAAACIDQAKGNAVDVGANEDVYEADVIVIGAGAAGMSAAYSACEAGASVIVLEANGHVGGSALVSAGNIDYIAADWLATLERNDAAVEPYLSYTEEDFPVEYHEDLRIVQEEVSAYLNDTQRAGAYDSISRIMLDHYKKGYGKDLDGVEVTMNYDYIRTAVEKNEEIYRWLADEGLTVTAGSRPHFVTPTRRGVELVEVLEKIAEKAGATIVCQTRATELLTDETGRVNGVLATNSRGESVTYAANKGVVIATGSFAANYDMVVRYQNVGKGISADTGTSNPKTNVGDGIVMAEKLGAALKDMQFIGFFGAGYKHLASDAEASKLSGAAQLCVSDNGVRFGNEDGNLTMKSIDQPNAVTNCVGDKVMYDALEAVQAGYVQDLESRGVLFTGETLEEAAQKAGIDAQVLSQTVAQYNAYVDAGNDPDFGRTKFNGKVEEGPFVIGKNQALNHLTFGGLVTDLEARVLKDDGTAIDGLYAAGDVVSGYEGYTHQTGECLTIVMYYGQIAGEMVAK